MASFEGLADASLAAAMNVQRFASGQTRSLAEYEQFIKLLQMPLFKDSEYKLLTDARKLPIYRRAWIDAFGPSVNSVPSEELLREISSLLQEAKPSESLQVAQANPIVDFCLALNRVFLEEDAEAYDGAHRARVSHGSF